MFNIVYELASCKTMFTLFMNWLLSRPLFVVGVGGAVGVGVGRGWVGVGRGR